MRRVYFHAIIAPEWAAEHGVIATSVVLPGWMIDEAPGLVVHRGFRKAGTGVQPLQSGPWYVSHVASGCRVDRLPFLQRQEALEFVRRLANLADWTRPATEIIQTLADREIEAIRMRLASEAQLPAYG